MFHTPCSCDPVAAWGKALHHFNVQEREGKVTLSRWLLYMIHSVKTPSLVKSVLHHADTAFTAGREGLEDSSPYKHCRSVQRLICQRASSLKVAAEPTSATSRGLHCCACPVFSEAGSQPFTSTHPLPESLKGRFKQWSPQSCCALWFLLQCKHFATLAVLGRCKPRASLSTPWENPCNHLENNTKLSTLGMSQQIHSSKKSSWFCF